MGPWASVIVAVSAVVAAFLVVMGFRGLIDAVVGVTARCSECRKAPMLPLPVSCARCWHCRHPRLHLPHPHLHQAGGVR